MGKIKKVVLSPPLRGHQIYSKEMIYVKVKLLNGEEFSTINVMEQKVNQGSTRGWVCVLLISTLLDSNQIDSLFTESNISEMVITAEDGSTKSLLGYNQLVSAVVRYNQSVTEIQVAKENTVQGV